MALERAADAARRADVSAFGSLSDSDLLAVLAGTDEDGRSILHAAAAGGSRPILEALLSRGAASRVNEADEEGWTPLHSSVSAGHLDTVQLLLNSGANIEAVTSGKRTPLHYAASKNPAVIPLLLASGAKPSPRDATGSTPLHRACGAGKLVAVKQLLQDKQVKLEARDGEGATPLLVATSCGHGPVALYLASAGADLEAQDKAGQTPLSAAAMHGALQQTMVALSRGDMDIDDVT